MRFVTTRTEPCQPIFIVEVIDEKGYAWLIPNLHLHDAVKISAAYEAEALPGHEPRIFIPPELLDLHLASD